MKILGIETSCDETALSLIEASGDINEPKFKVLNTALNSQIEKHREFGGVFPSLAKREHALNIVPLLSSLLNSENGEVKEGIDFPFTEIKEILEREPELFETFKKFLEENPKPKDLDFIAVTSGPGLEPALWVGINFAKALSLAWNIPLLPVNHMEGHIVSVLKESKLEQFPAIALLISGGHTELILIKSWGEYEIIGRTLDDAVGEAYDKVARILGLPYPGGPEISKLAEEGRHVKRGENKNRSEEISFPRPMIGSGDYNFSLSGLKTSVLYKVQKMGELDERMKIEIATEFEQAVVDVLKKKVSGALKEFGVNNLIVGGGVIANQYIRENLFNLMEELEGKVLFPEKDLSTDNGVMIAMAGFLKQFREKPMVNPEIKAEGNLSLND